MVSFPEVVVVGGGIQGLWILEKLRRHCQSILISDSDLGTGQTLHSHFLIHRGYCNPVIKSFDAKTSRAWKRLIDINRLPKSAVKPIYGFSAARSNFWIEVCKASGLRRPTRVQIPALLNQSEIMETFETDEYWLTGEDLIDIFRMRLEDLIYGGTVTRLWFETDGGPRLDVIIDGKHFELRPKFVVLACGVRNYEVLRTLSVSNLELWHKIDLTHGGRGPQRLFRSEVLILKSPELPYFGGLFPADHLYIVPRRDQDGVVWLIWDGLDEELDVRDVDLNKVLDPKPDRLRVTAEKVKRFFQNLPTRDLLCGAYADFRTEGRPMLNKKTHRLNLETIEYFDLSKLAVVWPGRLTLAPAAADIVLKVVRHSLELEGKSPWMADLPRLELHTGREKWRQVRLAPSDQSSFWRS